MMMFQSTNIFFFSEKNIISHSFQHLVTILELCEEEEVFPFGDFIKEVSAHNWIQEKPTKTLFLHGLKVSAKNVSIDRDLEF
jgi:hypothetical protein